VQYKAHISKGLTSNSRTVYRKLHLTTRR